MGDATAKIARQAGFRPQSAAGDADTLVQSILQSGARGPFVHLRGEHARGNVAGRLRDAGREVREDVIYAQELRGLTAEAQAVLGGELPVIVPLFSPRTAAQFDAVHKGGAPLFVATMSTAIAEALGKLHTMETMIARRPNAPSMIDAAERLFDAAQRLEGV
ncbi:uroporphyrinogen-III synthase [Rhodobacteraceae bacterium D3-12]|nr:uroporphyrinogen-III synthase [Rhodobacteraceae bacterium D3-12]